MYQLFAYYPDQLPMSVISQKKPTTLGNHHVKGFHDRFTQAREKWGVKCHMNFWTPCITLYVLYRQIDPLQNTIQPLQEHVQVLQSSKNMFRHIMKSQGGQFFDNGRFRALETTVKAEKLSSIAFLKQIDLSIEQKRSQLEQLQREKCVLWRLALRKT